MNPDLGKESWAKPLMVAITVKNVHTPNRHTPFGEMGSSGQRKHDQEEAPEGYASRLLPQGHEVWWYRQGAYVATAIAALGIWFVMIGPKEFSAKSEMVEPAIETLNSGLRSAQDPASLSKKLKFKVVPPNLRQLGGKLTRLSTAEFGGEHAVVFQYQYGKSVLLLYQMNKQSRLIKEMKAVKIGKSNFYCSSAGPATVVLWQDRRGPYYALAAKATEKDLVILASKVAKAFSFP